MAGIYQLKRFLLRNLRNYRPKLSRKLDLCFHEIKFGNRLNGRFNGGELLPQLFGEIEEYLRDLAFLFSFEILELVVRLDGLERFDENGRPARREAVRHAADPSPK